MTDLTDRQQALLDELLRDFSIGPELDRAYAKPYDKLVLEEYRMTTLNATDARAKLYSLIDEAAETHQPIVITGKRHNAVLLSEEYWKAINETMYLLSVPGMRESIREGMAARLDKCSKDLDW